MLGAIGNILLSIMHIKYLWLTESLKGQGMGTKIISMLEVEAIDWGLTSIALETYSFQAPEFYQKFGFIEASRLGSNAQQYYVSPKLLGIIAQPTNKNRKIITLLLKPPLSYYH